MPFVHVRGIAIYFEEHGAGSRHLLVAHGLLASVASARLSGLDTARVAAGGLHVIAYDARGHGRSGFTTDRADYRWAALAEDMHAIVDALGLERVSICGTSMGAGTALQFALAYPERVERLVLKSPPPFEVDMAASRRTLGALALAYRYLGAGVTARIAAAFSPEKRTTTRTLLETQRARAIVPAIRGLLFDQPQLPVDRVSEIRAPTLVLAHPDDSLHPLRSGEVLSQQMPHARLELAPNSLYWGTHREAFAERVGEFVKAAPGSPLF
jgi:pimeloyl-ACP methyl ester carboxylesterase